MSLILYLAQNGHLNNLDYDNPKHPGIIRLDRAGKRHALFEQADHDAHGSVRPDDRAQTAQILARRNADMELYIKSLIYSWRS